MEDSDRLHAGLGGDNEKLAFGVLKRGLQPRRPRRRPTQPLDLVDLGLRFDLTVPLARFYATHRAELPAVFRSIQVAPVWRAERPQKGRYRQFVQCDIDIIGEPGIAAEAELLTATLATVDALGLGDASIRINDRRLLIGMLEGFGFAAGRSRCGAHHDRQARQDRPGRRARRAARARASPPAADRRARDVLPAPDDDGVPAVRRGGDPQGAVRPIRTPRSSRPWPRSVRRSAPSGCSSTRSSCAGWATTRARSSSSLTRASTTRSAAAAATTG